MPSREAMPPRPSERRRKHRWYLAPCLVLAAALGLTDCTVSFSAPEPDDESCGDGVLSDNEVCDGLALGDETCQSQGFDTGALACQSDCAAFDLGGCHSCRVSCGGVGCSGLPCGPNGMICSTGACVCSGNGGPPQTSETSCIDSHDNDCDGLSDCDDPDCDGAGCGPNGVVCSAGACLCLGSSTELDCADGVDGDCDGSTDCGDTDCTNSVCGANGMVCSGETCACSGIGASPQAMESTCSDAIDNDCDGLSDCDDPDCNSRTCNVGLGYICDGQTCGPPP